MTREEVEVWRERIQCFGLMDNGDCSALDYGPFGPQPKQCLKCKLRKPEREVTGGVTYPYTPPIKKVRACRDYTVGKTVTIPTMDYSYCKECAYLSGFGSYMSCAYIQETGKRRPCRKGECKEAGIFKPIEGSRKNSRGWKKVHSEQKERMLALQKDDAGMNGGAVLLERIREDEMADILCMKDAMEALLEEQEAMA